MKDIDLKNEEKPEKRLELLVEQLSSIIELPVVYESHKSEEDNQYKYTVGIKFGPNCISHFMPPLPLEQAEMCVLGTVNATRSYRNLRVRRN